MSYDTYPNNSNNFENYDFNLFLSIRNTRNSLQSSQGPLHIDQLNRSSTGKFNVDLTQLKKADKAMNKHLKALLGNKKPTAIKQSLTGSHPISCDSECQGGNESSNLSRVPIRFPKAPHPNAQYLDKYALPRGNHPPIDLQYPSFGRDRPNTTPKLPNKRTFLSPYVDTKYNEQKSLYGIPITLQTSKLSRIDEMNKQHHNLSNNFNRHNSNQTSNTFGYHCYSEPLLPSKINNSSSKSVNERSLNKFSHIPGRSSFEREMQDFIQNTSTVKKTNRKPTYCFSTFSLNR